MILYIDEHQTQANLSTEPFNCEEQEFDLDIVACTQIDNADITSFPQRCYLFVYKMFEIK